MPDKRITDLTAASGVASTDIIPIVLDPAGAAALRKATIGDIAAAGAGGLSGAGSPEGAVIASPGVTYLNTTDDSFWVKKTGTGNTGWINLIA